MTTEAERDCKHGQLARSCNVCELEAEVARQAAEIEQLKSEMEDQGSSIERLRKTVAAQTKAKDAAVELWNEAGKELERANALLRQALESCYEGDYSTGHVIDPSFDSVAVDNSIAAIKQHLGEV